MVDTVRSETDLLVNLFQEGQADASISSQDMRDLIVSSVNVGRHGFFDYNDNETASTPIALTATTETKLTNDGAGAFSNFDFKPFGITDVWDTTNDQFDLTELPIGTTLTVRITYNITTTVANTDVTARLHFGLGNFPYTIPFDQTSYKNSGVHEVSRTVSFYVGDVNTKDFPGEIHITSDKTASVIVLGWFINVHVR